MDKQGRVKDTLGNLALILRNDPRLKDIAYNIHRSGIDIRRDVGRQDHAALDAHQARLERVRPRLAADLSRSRVHALHAGKAQEHPCWPSPQNAATSHPRLHRIAAAWDGVPRVDTLFVDYLGAGRIQLYTRARARRCWWQPSRAYTSRASSSTA